MEQSIFILFGKTGAGKNFTAAIWEKNLGYDWYDADIDLTGEMVDAIVHQHPFTQAMRDEYFQIVTARINDLLHTKKRIIITQGLFKNQNRHDLMKEFPAARWVWVDADPAIIQKRVCQRNGMVTPDYAQKINQYFEEPDFICDKILNNRGEAEILIQAGELIKKLESPAVC